MEHFTKLKSRAVLLLGANVDTDQIIPARFLKSTSKEGLGDALFCDWRFEADGSPKPDFVLNEPEAKGAEILVVGPNFGCGSSREHAPWALQQFGFRAVVGTTLGDIFRQNSLKNGLLPAALSESDHGRLVELLREDSRVEAEVDVEAQELRLGDSFRARFPLEPFAKTCLLQGVDELGFLLGREDEIARFESRHASPIHTGRV